MVGAPNLKAPNLQIDFLFIPASSSANARCRCCYGVTGAAFVSSVRRRRASFQHHRRLCCRASSTAAAPIYIKMQYGSRILVHALVGTGERSDEEVDIIRNNGVCRWVY